MFFDHSSTRRTTAGGVLTDSSKADGAMNLALTDSLDENRLLMRVRQGDRAALTHTYEQYFPLIYRFVRLRVQDQPTAEDIASEVFVKLIRTAGKPNGPQQSLKGWLFKVARNEIYRHAGSGQVVSGESLDERIPDGSGDREDLEAELVRTADVARTQSALRMLAPDQQEVLILRFSEGFSLQEVADLVGKSIGAVKSLQFRAVDTLRRILAGETANHV